MNPYARSKFSKEGQTVLQTDNLAGVYKGIVEDCNDPMNTGRVRVRVYSVHGDYRDSPTESIPWSDCIHGTRGSYNSPELFDRVWVSFENGDKNYPVWLGFWYATPAGLGTLPHDQNTGLDIPKDYWMADSEFYPQTQGVARSGEGNGIWFEDSTHQEEYTGVVNIQNSGGVYLKLRTRQIGVDYRPRGGTMTGGGWSDPKVYRQRDTSWNRGAITNTSELDIGNQHFRLWNIGHYPTDRCVTRVMHKAENTIDVRENYRGKWRQDKYTDGPRTSVFIKNGRSVFMGDSKISVSAKDEVPEAW